MKITFRFLYLLAPLFLFSLSKAWSQDERSLSYFDEIVTTGSIEVILEQGDAEKALVYAKGIDTDKVKTNVKGGILKVSVLKSLVKKGDHVRVRVFFRQLRRIKVQAGAELSAAKRMQIDKLDLKATSGGHIELELQVNALDVVASEGGQLDLEGKTESLDARIVSGGNLSAFHLDSDHTYVTANTGGVAQVVAYQSLEASANTGGKIDYKGDPAKTKTKDLLTGKIRQL